MVFTTDRFFEDNIYIYIYIGSSMTYLILSKISVGHGSRDKVSPTWDSKLWPLYILKETPTQAFFCEYCKIFKSTYFEKQLRTAASVSYVLLLSEPYGVKLNYSFNRPKCTYHITYTRIIYARCMGQWKQGFFQVFLV